MKHRGRLTCVLVLGSIVLGALGPAVLVRAENWGALDPENRCTHDEFSQCTANNGIHNVWLSPGLASGLASAVQNTLNNDFEPIAGISTDITTNSGDTDVQVFDGDWGYTVWSAYETCAGFATFGGSGIHEWCRPHLLFFNNGGHPTAFNSFDKRAHSACHEIGHTLGLRHATKANHPTPGSSCMKDGVYTTDLHNHDKNHLEDEY